MKGTIIAMGGGGFSTEVDNSLLDQYILDSSSIKQPKICFVPTASGDNKDYISKFFSAFSQHECQPFCLSLFKPQIEDIESFLLGMDIIYVGGGNTKNMLALWEAWGIPKILEKCMTKGIMLAGVSAGIICWFEAGITDSYHGKLSPINGLGFLTGSVCPHCDSEESRVSTYIEYLEKDQIPFGYALDDGVALHFKDGHLLKVVASKSDAQAYFISKKDTSIDKNQLKITTLIT